MMWILIPVNSQDKVVWNYPIHPGTEEWKSLNNYAEQLRAYNLPPELIGVISTEELVKTCLSYPEWRLINAYSNRQIGLANIIGLFNGFHELLKRTDSGKELVKIYIKVDPLSIKQNWTPLQKGTFSFQLTCIEMLLSHEAIINQLDQSYIQTLLDVAILKYKKKKQLPEVYSLWDLSPTAGLCLSILDKEGMLLTKTPDLLLFLRTFMTADIEILDQIIETSEKR